MLIKTFSQLFSGLAASEKDSKEETKGLAEDASTAPGSGGEDASEGSDTSTEEPPPSHGFDGEPACGAGQPGIEDESAGHGNGNTEAPQPPVSPQAASDGTCAAEGRPTCVEKTERRMDQIEKNDGIGDPCVLIAAPNAAEDEARVARCSPVRRPNPRAKPAMDKRDEEL